MKIIYARQPIDRLALQTGSIFCAGPTPRDQDAKSWRPEAIEYFRKLNYSGTLLIPEDEDGIFKGEVEKQIDWEDEGLTYCNVILFWVPRQMNGMPGLTTNDEWGTWKKSGKCIFGAPEDAEHVSYQLYYARKLNIPNFITLNETIDAAVQMDIRNVIKLTQPINVTYLDDYCKDCGMFLRDGENHFGYCIFPVEKDLPTNDLPANDSVDFAPEPA